MVRRMRIRGVVVGIAIVVVSCCLVDVRHRAFGQKVSKKSAKAALKERDRLRNETQRLRREGKLAEAIAAAEAVLAIEQKVLSADHPDVADSLGWLAALNLARDDFAAARAARQDALRILRERFGEAHWKVTDARLALEDVDARASLTVEDQQ
jgi:hypothetical protein